MVLAELPLWVAHGGASTTSSSTTSADSLSLLLSRQTKTAIYSIDVSSNNTIFATAGGDGAIRIWNTGALFPHHTNRAAHFKDETGAYVSSSGGSAAEEEEEEGQSSGAEDDSSAPANRGGPVHDLTAVARRKDGSATTAAVTDTAASATASTAPTDTAAAAAATSTKRKPSDNRLLCTLTAHTGSSVLCVRFSHSGQYLASAGDDACVCIYAAHEQDQWRRTKLCRGHGLDVVDLAWAPDDSCLVSCSLDSATPIIVWKPTAPASSADAPSSMICTPYKILGASIHTSTVKGVTFDPAGSYVASSGDDPAVCIWRAHDDWGLEARIDHENGGIFRQWKGDSDGVVDSMTQSLFRRISWSTDGSFLCTTNAVVKNKHVASTIAREGWTTASAPASGAANLVGHKQPVVVSRHASQLLKIRKEKKTSQSGSSDENEMDDDDDDDDDPEYATLLALGDRKGFVTVWSTKKSRPIFKLQCSESHCTVTDLSWGTIGDSALLLLVALLDGQVVALRFFVPDETGPLLSTQEKNRMFQLRYGIDTDVDCFVGQSSGPRLIENTLQMSLEEQNEDDEQNNDAMEIDDSSPGPSTPIHTLEARSIKDQQKESRSSKGKRRVQPVLMPVVPQKRPKATSPEKTATPAKDPVQQAIEVTERTIKATAATDAAQKGPTEPAADPTPARTPTPAAATTRERQPLLSMLAHCKEKLYSVDLPLPESIVQDEMVDTENQLVFDCSNVTKTPAGSKGGSMACIEASIKQGGKITWKDTIPGSSCCALAASRYLVAAGTTDGSIMLFGTSPSLGWTSRSCCRSHPPLIVGHAIVALQLKEEPTSVDMEENTQLKMLVVAADGFFAVYSLAPDLAVLYKGTILPAISHMSLSTQQGHWPELSRAFLLKGGSVAILLSFFQTGTAAALDQQNAPNECGPGGALQGFVYLPKMKLWARAADSRFVLSDFFSSLPVSRQRGAKLSVLDDMDDAVRLGSLHSTLKASRRTRIGDRQANLVYSQLDEDSGNFLASRSHCEDRLACAFALESATEFKKWLGLYVRVLVAGSRDAELRHLVDILIPTTLGGSSPKEISWMGSAATILDVDKKELAKVMLTEVGKNRNFQRLANEISMQLEAIA